MDNLFQVAELFQITGKVDQISAWGGGHINKTFKVSCDSGNDYILQKINTDVFTRPNLLMENVASITHHILQQNTYNDLVAPLIHTRTNQNWIHNKYGFWRMSEFKGDKIAFDVAESKEDCRLAGRSYGAFLAALDDFPVKNLHVTIPQFHDIKFRMGQFEEAVNDDSKARKIDIDSEIRLIKKLASGFIQMFEILKKEHPIRVTHNDTKLNNVLIGDGTIGTVIDLDTVMPGYAFFDVGDALRSMAISAKEDEEDLNSIHLDRNKMHAFLDGYLSETKDILGDREIALLRKSGAYMAFIMAVRFLSDYLNGDIYYHTQYPNHNLVRARNQLKVCELFSMQNV